VAALVEPDAVVLGSFPRAGGGNAHASPAPGPICPIIATASVRWCKRPFRWFGRRSQGFCKKGRAVWLALLQVA